MEGRRRELCQPTCRPFQNPICPRKTSCKNVGLPAGWRGDDGQSQRWRQAGGPNEKGCQVSTEPKFAIFFYELPKILLNILPKGYGISILVAIKDGNIMVELTTGISSIRVSPCATISGSADAVIDRQGGGCMCEWKRRRRALSKDLHTFDPEGHCAKIRGRKTQGSPFPSIASPQLPLQLMHSVWLSTKIETTETNCLLCFVEGMYIERLFVHCGLVEYI